MSSIADFICNDGFRNKLFSSLFVDKSFCDEKIKICDEYFSSLTAHFFILYSWNIRCFLLKVPNRAQSNSSESSQVQHPHDQAPLDRYSSQHRLKLNLSQIEFKPSCSTSYDRVQDLILHMKSRDLIRTVEQRKSTPYIAYKLRDLILTVEQRKSMFQSKANKSVQELPRTTYKQARVHLRCLSNLLFQIQFPGYTKQPNTVRNMG